MSLQRVRLFPLSVWHDKAKRRKAPAESQFKIEAWIGLQRRSHAL